MTMLAEMVAVPIEKRQGVWFVEGTRVPFDTVVVAYEGGAAAEEIVYRYPTLRLSDVYTLIAYYLNNQEAVTRYLQEREQTRAKIREINEKAFPPHQLRARLLMRKAAPRP